MEHLDLYRAHFASLPRRLEVVGGKGRRIFFQLMLERVAFTISHSALGYPSTVQAWVKQWCGSLQAAAANHALRFPTRTDQEIDELVALYEEVNGEESQYSGALDQLLDLLSAAASNTGAIGKSTCVRIAIRAMDAASETEDPEGQLGEYELIRDEAHTQIALLEVAVMAGLLPSDCSIIGR